MSTAPELRPPVTEWYHTADLPPLPQRDRLFPASLWVEAPETAKNLGTDLGYDLVAYKRLIGTKWLLWRAGPAVHADSIYLAVDATDLDTQYTYRLFADGTGFGVGPDGIRHERFRTWKESLRDSH